MKTRRLTNLALLAAGLALLSTGTARAGVDIYEIIERAPSREDYPEAKAAILYHRIVYTLDDSWRGTREEELLVKLFNKQGQTDFGDMKRQFDSRTQAYEVVRAATILPDWTEIDVDEKAINEITPPYLVNASIYANVLQEVISYPGLQDDAVIYLNLRRVPLEPDEPDVEPSRGFWTTALFQSGEPILYKEVVIKVPHGRPLYTRTLNGTLEPEVTREDDLDVYTWRIENAAMIVPEPNMPPYSNIGPRVEISSAATWEELGSWCTELYEEKLAESTETGDTLDETVREITRGLETEDDMIREVFLFVVGEIRNVNLGLGVAGYGPHAPAVVLENRYGDPRDKAVLLTAMLRRAGIEAYPAFVKIGRQDFVQEIAGLNQFHGVFVAVPRDGTTLWLDPFAEYSRYGYLPRGHDSEALILRGGGEITRTRDYEAEENVALREYRVTIRDDGTIEGKVSCRLSGPFDTRARGRLKYATPEQEQQFFEGAVSAIMQGAQETSRERSDLGNLTVPVEVSQEFVAEEYAVVQGDMMIFRMPPFPFGFASLGFYPSLTERRLPFVLGDRVKDVYRGEVRLPEGYRIAYLPGEYRESNEFGEWKFRCDYDEKESLVTFTSEVVLSKLTVAPDDYPEFKKTIDGFSSPKNHLLLLERLPELSGSRVP